MVKLLIKLVMSWILVVSARLKLIYRRLRKSRPVKFQLHRFLIEFDFNNSRNNLKSYHISTAGYHLSRVTANRLESLKH